MRRGHRFWRIGAGPISPRRPVRWGLRMTCISTVATAFSLKTSASKRSRPTIFKRRRSPSIVTVDADRPARLHNFALTIHAEGDAEGKPLVVSHPCELKSGQNVVPIRTVLANPRLWWPNGYGEAESVCCGGDDLRQPGSIRDEAPRVLHRDAVTFGIRKLEKIFGEGHEMSPYPWTFVVNGKKNLRQGCRLGADESAASDGFEAV